MAPLCLRQRNRRHGPLQPLTAHTAVVTCSMICDIGRPARPSPADTVDAGGVSAAGLIPFSAQISGSNLTDGKPQVGTVPALMVHASRWCYVYNRLAGMILKGFPCVPDPCADHHLSGHWLSSDKQRGKRKRDQIRIIKPDIRIRCVCLPCRYCQKLCTFCQFPAFLCLYRRKRKRYSSAVTAHSRKGRTREASTVMLPFPKAQREALLPVRMSLSNMTCMRSIWRVLLNFDIFLLQKGIPSCLLSFLIPCSH